MGVTEDLKRHASRWYKLLEEWAYTRYYLERNKRRETIIAALFVSLGHTDVGRTDIRTSSLSLFGAIFIPCRRSLYLQLSRSLSGFYLFIHCSCILFLNVCVYLAITANEEL